VSSASGADDSPKAEVSQGFAAVEPSAHSTSCFEAGTLIQGRYQLQEEVGVGGLGAVWSAWHMGFDHAVALKFLKPELADHPEAVSRFNAEARACFVLRSEHVVRVLDVDSHEGVPFIVMELLDGTDLRAALDEAASLGVALDPAEVVDYALQVCEGLCAAHAGGIIHRDIKPENLFLHGTGDSGVASIKLLDFGISQVEMDYERDPNLRDSAPAGTPPYMSPEQLQAAAVDARSDVWSLGCVLYELLTGTAPFERDTLQDSCTAVQESEPALASTLRAELPEGLSEVVERCLRKDPAERFADAAQLAAALAEFGTGRLDDYPARCYAQLTGERRSSPEPIAARRLATPLPAAGARRSATPLPAAGARRLATPLPAAAVPRANPDENTEAMLRTLTARTSSLPTRAFWAATVVVGALGVMSWVNAQRDEEAPHIVTPSTLLQPESRPALAVETEVLPVTQPDALPAGAAAALEEGQDEPKVLMHSGKRRARHSARTSRYQRRHAQRDPDVGF
jgi:hypothetical protein